jgi:HEPN domain-containing protein
MKPITHEWLARATDDLATAQVLLSHEHLTNMVAFHAQQGVEKALKAIIEELDLGLVKTHSLIRLYEMIRPRYPVIEDMDMLDRLEAVYIGSRYPGEMGLLPTGKPTREEATDLFDFATDVFQRLLASLKEAEVASQVEHGEE